MAYTKQTWDTTSYVTPTRMNHIEEGIRGAVNWNANKILGAKNLNSLPYFHGAVGQTKEHNGITFTVNADGSITANGTASGGNALFQCHTRLNTDKNILIVPNGKYILSGCPSGGGSSAYHLQALSTINSVANVYGYDTGSGKDITLNGDDYSNDSVTLGIYITIINGKTVNNLVFKPMLRVEADDDTTFIPYAMTNRQLSEVANQILISKRYLKKSENTGNKFYLQGKTNTWFKVCFAYSEYNVLFTTSFAYNTVAKIGGETVEVTINTETGVVTFSGNNSSIRNATNVLVEEIPV